MRIYGIDFTCAPWRRKPITCALARLDGDLLRVEHVVGLRSLAAFEASLRAPGPWVAGFDFPFGQPRKLIESLGWPTSWTGYVSAAGQLSRPEWVDLLQGYSAARPAGDKHHFRPCDRLARACSPMMLYRTPVARMFHAAAPRLLAAGVSVLPCAPSADPRVALEAYPKLVAQKWIGSRSYKADERAKQTPEREQARRDLMTAVRSTALRDIYGLSLSIGNGLAEAVVREPTGDRLDAVLCAIQAAWAYSRREVGWGIPSECDPDEGWIVDSALL